MSTIVLLLVVGFASESFAGTFNLDNPLVKGESVPSKFKSFEPILSDENFHEHFTEEDNEYLSDFEAYYAAKEFYSLKDNIVFAGARVRIKVDRSKQTLSVYVAGKRKYTWKTTTGSAARFGKGARTPKGTFKPYGMTAKHHSRKGYTLPYSIKMYRGYFIHGTKAEHMLGKKLSRSVGSHGCMRLSMKNARTLFNLVKKYGLKKTEIVVL